MDVFYEESAICQDDKKGAKRYRILHIISYIIMIIMIILAISTVMMIPAPESIFLGVQALMFFAIWFILYKWKSRINVSYDYCFVSGELRISRVININKRKLVTRFESEEIIQIGDVENSSYERLSADPMTKNVICTSNMQPGEGKFFMYILVNDNGKKLYVLECRETLLMHILKFAKRSTLETDYVMQEKKQKKV